MSKLPTLSNARFISVRSNRVAHAIVGNTDQQLVIRDFGVQELNVLERNFNVFVERLRDAFSGNHVRRGLSEAHEIFDIGVLPALRLLNVEINDAKDYSDSSLTVSAGKSSPCHCCSDREDACKIPTSHPSASRSAEVLEQLKLRCSRSPGRSVAPISIFE